MKHLTALRYISFMTESIFGIPYEQAVDKSAPDYKERRTIAKNVNFGVFYGLFARGLQRTLRFKAGLDKSLEDCEAIIANLKAGYPNLARWQEQARQAATRRQYTQTFLGRRRYLPGHSLAGLGNAQLCRALCTEYADSGNRCRYSQAGIGPSHCRYG